MRTALSPVRILMLAGALLAQPAAGAWAGQDGHPPLDVQGDERLVWDQPASSPDELAGLGFLSYVNGHLRPLYSVACGDASGPEGFECSAALPALDPGVNVVEVAAYLGTEAAREGQRSPPIYLRLGGSPAGLAADLRSLAPVSAPAMGRTWTTADGARLQARELATGLDDPTDLLPLPDGRVLIAELGGRVRVFRDGRLTTGLELSDVSIDGGGGLLALAAGPAFSSTRHVFALYSTEDGLRVARFTMAGDALVDRAILLDGLPAGSAEPGALLRMGPDGRLYLALGDGGDPRRLGDQGSYNGKVLRVAVDGTTPADQASPSPVWSIGVSRPVGLAWTADASRPRLIGIEVPEPGSARALLAAPNGGERVTRFLLAPEVGATRAAIGGGPALSALEGDVIVASGREHAVLRIRLAGGVPAVIDWLIEDLPGPATAVAVAPDGGVYVAAGATLVRITGA